MLMPLTEMDSNNWKNNCPITGRNWLVLFLPVTAYLLFGISIKKLLALVIPAEGLCQILLAFCLLFFSFYVFKKKKMPFDNQILLTSGLLLNAVFLAVSFAFAVRLFLPFYSSPVSGAVLLCSVILGPVSEELLYRGVFAVQAERMLGRTGAIILSSAVFAFAHTTAIKILFALILGSALGLIYLKTRNLILPILIHAIVNLIAVLPVTIPLPLSVISIICFIVFTVFCFCNNT